MSCYTAVIHNLDTYETHQTLFVYECNGDHYNDCRDSVTSILPNKTATIPITSITKKLKVEVPNPEFRLEVITACDSAPSDSVCASSTFEDVVMEAEGANETYLIAEHATRLTITVRAARPRELLVLADDWLFSGALT